MIDFILGLALAAMLVRGWLRGFVRETLDLVGLVVGIWLAFRLSVPFGDFLTDGFGVSPEVGRIGGGILLFVLFGVLLSVAAHFLTKMMNLPGLSLVNRVGGAGVAIGWGVAVVVIVVSLVGVAPVPDGWREQLDDSRVVELIAGDEAVPRRVFESLAGDNVMSAMASLREIFGSPRAVPEGDQVLEIPPAPEDEIRQSREDAARLVEMLNEDRVGVGLNAVQPVDAITALAERHAELLYTTGRLHKVEDCGGELSRRSHPVLRCSNGVALAGTAHAAYSGIYESVEGRSMVESPGYDRVGMAVVEGPTGRLVVVVLGG